MQVEAIGRAIGSPSQYQGFLFYGQHDEDYDEEPWADPVSPPDMVVDDSSDVSFSFSEADLVPPSKSPSAASFDYHQMAYDRPRSAYASTHDFLSDDSENYGLKNPRITIHRTFLVSEPSTPSPQTPSQPLPFQAQETQRNPLVEKPTKPTRSFLTFWKKPKARPPQVKVEETTTSASPLPRSRRRRSFSSLVSRRQSQAFGPDFASPGPVQVPALPVNALDLPRLPPLSDSRPQSSSLANKEPPSFQDGVRHRRRSLFGARADSVPTELSFAEEQRKSSTVSVVAETPRPVSRGRRKSAIGSKGDGEQSDVPSNGRRKSFTSAAEAAFALFARSRSLDSQRRTTLRTKSMLGDLPPMPDAKSTVTTTESEDPLRAHPVETKVLARAAKRDADGESNANTSRRSSMYESRRRSIVGSRASAGPKDELANALRSLETSHQRFLTRPAPAKAAIIETVLLPFLRDFASHPSNKSCHFDLLQRRCAIFDKWWSAINDLLDDWDSPILQSRDRSSALEAIVRLMQRQEWRRVPDFSPFVDRALQAPEDGEEALLAESVHVLIRDLFVKNLTRQLSFSVTRLASRESNSLMSQFSGFVCAYAIYFCPGVAETLVSLWKLPATMLRKTVDQLGNGASDKIKAVSSQVVQTFPSHLHASRFTSIRSNMARLSRQTSNKLLSPGQAGDQQWLSKWSGKRTELIFVFFKHFLILLADFMPEHSTQVEILAAPICVAVQTKMIMTMSSAFQSDLHVFGMDLPNQVDTVLDANGALDVAVALSSARSLVAKRFMILIKDFIDLVRPSRLFVTFFGALVKSMAGNISLYDHDACFSLCDFLEDYLQMLIPAQSDEQIVEKEVGFWVGVLRLMLQSDNNVTAMRVFVLVFNIWPAVIKSSPWRLGLCEGLLLDDEIFASHFNHWCPLVRVFFMRLLAWRVARVDRARDAMDRPILFTLLSRVQNSWAHYQHAYSLALEMDTLPPSSVPCNPVPGRRLLIIRTDDGSSQMQQQAPPPASLPQRLSVGKEDSTFNPLQLFARLSVSLEDGFDASKRASTFMKTKSGFRGADDHISPPPESVLSAAAWRMDPSKSSPSQSSRSSMYEHRPSSSGKAGARDPRTLKSPAKTMDPTLASANQSPVGSFKFSLEVVDRRVMPEISLKPPRLPLLSQIVLETLPEYVADVGPRAPATKAEINLVKYTGRALAEWSLAVNECQNFFDRRKREGVVKTADVETPSLGMEAFRRSSNIA